jgi:tetratricopeptide (TPR) repeat protein
MPGFLMQRCVVIWIALLALASMAPAQGGAAEENVKPDQLYRTGVVSLGAKKFPEAEAAFRQLYELEPGNLRGLMGIVQVYTAQGKEEDAMRLLDTEIAKSPGRSDLLTAAGDTAMLAKNYDKAVAFFEQALAAIPPESAAGVYMRLSDAWQKKGDNKSALEAVRHAKDLSPRDPAILSSLAVQLDAAGQKKEALEAYRTALEVDSRNAMALNNAAYLMAETGGDLYEALRYAQRADLLSPGNAPIADTIGWVKLKLGWTDDAVATFVRLVAHEPANVSYRAHLLAALEKSGAHTPGIAELMKELKKDPVPENTDRITTILKSGLK